MNNKIIILLSILMLFFFSFVTLNKTHEIKNKKSEIYTLKDSIKTIQYKRQKFKKLQNRIDNYNTLFHKLSNSEHCRYVDVTMYNLQEHQTDSTPFITADNTNLRDVNLDTVDYVACSRDLHAKFGGILEFDDKILLLNAGPKSGIYKVKDIMNARFRRRIDIVEPLDQKEYIYKNAFIIHLPDESKKTTLPYKIASLYKNKNQ